MASGAHKGLGTAIKVRRTELGLKRKDLADRAELSYPYISEIENGQKEPSSGALRRIADALAMDASLLLELSEQYEETSDLSLERLAGSRAEELRAPPSAYFSRLPAPARRTTAPKDGADVETLVVDIVRSQLDAWATYRLPDLIRSEVERQLEELDERS